MVSRILNAFDDTGFEGLIGIRKFLDAFTVSFGARRKLLRIARLSSAIRSHLSAIVSQFVRRAFSLPRRLLTMHPPESAD
jgi:hypothetical protein